MTEADLYKELGALTKDKDRWKESIPYVSSLLTHESVKIQAKALWLLGEMGLAHPQSVQDVIHKSTFYFYYEWVDDVLAEIKARMMNLLVSTIESKNRDAGAFQQVMIEMRKMFRENRKYLVPLVLEQRGGEFSVNYREYIKEHFAEDIGLDYKTGNDVKNDVANCVLAGLVEIMLYELSSEIIPDEFTFRIGDGIIKKGVALTLNEDLNIKFGK